MDFISGPTWARTRDSRIMGQKVVVSSPSHSLLYFAFVYPPRGIPERSIKKPELFTNRTFCKELNVQR
jgi:hypothetical protein